MHDLWAFDFKEKKKKISAASFIYALLPSERIHKREIPWTVPVFLGSLTSLSVTFMLCLHQSAKYLVNSQLPSTEPETWWGEGGSGYLIRLGSLDW